MTFARPTSSWTTKDAGARFTATARLALRLDLDEMLDVLPHLRDSERHSISEHDRRRGRHS
jgi:hypothetical protein